MEEEPEDLSSLHYQILFPPREPSHQQREYELEQHLALMDEPARAPAQKAMDMGDLGNLTIEHLTSYDKDETQERFLFMEDEEKCQDDVLDIGIEANDLGSLLQQFEQTEAAAITDSMEHREIPKSRLKSSKHQDAKNLAKKITPVKRKSTILLEPLAMPTKRLRAKETNLLIAERECVSLPGSRTSSPVTIQHQGLSEICSADQGFDYLVMDHDYCSPSGQKVNQINSASSSPLNDSSRLSVEERKAVYKQKYKIRKKGKKLSGASGGKHSESAKEGVLDPVNLINKLPDYIRPMPEVAVPVKTNQTGKQTEDKSTERAADDPTEEESVQDKDSKPSFFDKIPDYFLGKHMYQEISKVEEEEARKKEEEEMTKLKEKEEMEKFQQIKDTSKDHSHRYRSRHRQRDRGRHHRKTKSSICDEEQDLNRDTSVTTETLESDTGNTGVINDDKHCNEYAQSPATEFEGISHGHSHCENRKTSGSDRYSRCRSLSSPSSRSRSSSRSLSRDRSCSTSSSCSSYPRRRCRRDSRMSYTSLSSTSQSRSRSRSRSRSFRRRRRRRYSTYSSASRSSSSRSRSRSHSRPRHWRPRSHSRSHSRSSSSSRRRSRSGSYYSRSRSRESDRRRRDGHRRRHSRSRSRRRMRSVSVERIQKERREERLKEQQEQWSDRRVVYIGRIPNGTTRNTLRKRFEKFGEIERITLHFRDVGDNYAFVTFMYKCDAYAAVDGANKDYNEPEYDICFGGRRHFCRTNYEDLDSMGQEEIALDIGYQQEPASNQGGNKMETDFDRLLREAMKKSKR